MQKRGYFSAETMVQTWQPGAGAGQADMARGTRADATRHARPHGRAARGHVRRRWRTGREGLASEGPKG